MTMQVLLNRRSALAFGAGGLALASRPSWAFQNADASAIDAIVSAFMSAFEIPGIAVAIVRPGAQPFMRGYGVRTLGRPERVDTNTLFGIASNTKAFTAAALAMLVEEGKLSWDDPVVRHMPDFKMSDPAITQMMTVRDLLSHRSGLALGAGDLMQFPKSDRTAEELLRALQYLPFARGFRAGYAYDNILYIVAGILIERKSGMKWNDFVARRFFTPLHMPNAVATLSLVRTNNIVGRHARLGPPLRGMGPLAVISPGESSVIGTAGGIHASVADAVPWLQTQLGKGQALDLPRLWSAEQAEEMWKPQIIVTSTTGPSPSNPVRSVLQAYALGWFILDFRERRLVTHSGGLSGQITYTALLPDYGIGLVVYSNTEDSMPILYLQYALLDHLVGAPPTDWIAAARLTTDKQFAEARKLAASGEVPRPTGGPSLPLSRYAGTYRDPWYGDITISQRNGGLYVDFTRTPVFKGMLEPWGPDTFRTHWPKDAGEDAVVKFAIANGQVRGMTMKALSPLADFSYDFHDLVLTKVR